MNKRTTTLLLFFAATLTIAAVAAQLYIEIGQSDLWWLTAGLILTFTLLVIIGIFLFDNPMVTRICFLINTLLIASIFVMHEGTSADSIFTCFFILSSCVALLLPLREAALWIVGFSAIQSGLLVNAIDWSILFHWASFIGGHFMFASFGYLMRKSNDHQQQTESLYGELQETHAQLQQYATKVENLAVAEERNRLAREIHDSLGHRLTVAVLQLEGAQRLIPTEPDRAAEMVGAMRTQLKESLSELRSTLSTLRAPETEEKMADQQVVHAAAVPNRAENELASSSLRADLTEMVQTFCGATDLAVDLKIESDLPPLSPPQRLGIYRAAQELLTNVYRHAEAQNAWVDLAQLADSGTKAVLLKVEDDGRGMPTEIGEARFGLQGLSERAAQLGGSFDLATGEHGGTIARFRIPLMQGAVA